MRKLVENKRRNSGSALIVSLVVMFMIAVLGISYLTFASTNLMRADRDNRRLTAFYLADAGVEYELAAIANDVEANGGGVVSASIDSTSLLRDLKPGNETSGTITVAADTASTGVIISTATYRGITEKIRVVVKIKGIGIWDNAIFGGVGQVGQAIKGNAKIRGSVHIIGEGDPFTDLNGNGKWDSAETYTDINGNNQYDSGEPIVDRDGDNTWDPAEPYRDDNFNGAYDSPLTATDLASDLSGNANIGNNYSDMSPIWLDPLNPKVPLLVAQDVNGETVETLETEVRVKHGTVNLSGSGTAGDPNVAGNDIKERLDGMYVTDGYGGTAGTTNVFSDNGTTQGYDLGDKIKFPSLLEPYKDKNDNNTPYKTYEDYLLAKSMPITETNIITSSTSFSYTSPNGANSISWNKSTGVLSIKGIIRFPGNLDIAENHTTIKYEGRGTLFVQGNVNVHGNLMPKTTFPTVDAIGVISKGDISLAAGEGESQIQAMGAWFAQKRILSGMQSEFAGTYVANYFDMGKQVPKIFQTPALSSNLPPGMPGSDVRIVVSKAPSWRHL
ncbi:MAG: hypothetical protein ACYC0V_15740 [Armatimonadota bacterium]